MTLSSIWRRGLALPGLLAAAVVLAVAVPALAQEPPDFGQKRQGFELNLGAGATFWPAYPGSAVTRVRPFPFINGGYGEWLDFDVLDGLRLSALRGHGLSFGPILRFREGRDSDSSQRNLTGLRSFSDTVEAGLFLAYEAGPFYADASFTQDVAHNHRGAALDARALVSVPVGRVAFSIGPELRVVTQRFAQSFYGVGEAEATTSRYQPYRAGGGLERIGGLLAMQWKVTERWSLFGYAEYGRLQGSAADSPLVRTTDGSADQVLGGLFLSYRFY